jgi:DNA-binding HxlR family transcriptional regulator/putative sterol carrier protein
MTRRGYGQVCGLSHALEIVGERWALLIVRELVGTPKRFTDLRQGLPRIPTNVLSARLKELEQAEVLQRRILPRPASAVVYELTEYGRDLEEILLALGRWGAQSMGQPEAEDDFTIDSLMMAMRASYQGQGNSSQPAAEPVSYELRVNEIVISLTVQDGQLGVADGPQPKPDLVIEANHGFTALLTGKTSPSEAIESGSVRVIGDPGLLTEFANTFRA